MLATEVGRHILESVVGAEASCVSMVIEYQVANVLKPLLEIVRWHAGACIVSS